MADVTHAELKDALRFAGEMEKAFSAFRRAGEFALTMSKAIAAQEKLEGERNSLLSEVSGLNSRIASLKAEVVRLGSDVAGAAAARSAREQAAETASLERIAAIEKNTREAEEFFRNRKAELAKEAEGIASELAAKVAELEAVKSELAAIRSRFS